MRRELGEKGGEEACIVSGGVGRGQGWAKMRGDGGEGWEREEMGVRGMKGRGAGRERR